MEGKILGKGHPKLGHGHAAEVDIIKKANVNKQDKKGTCGFFLACMNGETYYRVVQINRD